MQLPNISDSGSESATESDSDTAYSPSKRVKSEMTSVERCTTITIPVDVIKSKDFNQTADSTGLSVRHRIRLLSSIFRASIKTPADDNPDEIQSEMPHVLLSPSTSYRASKSTRKDIASEIKANFLSPTRASVHMDAKKVTDSCSEDRK